MFLGIRLWDYSGLSFNINGRIRLITSIAWANCSIVLVYILQPKVKLLFDKLKIKNYFYSILHIILWGMFIDLICAFIKYL